LCGDERVYHSLMEAYVCRRQILVVGCGGEGHRAAVLNSEDEHGERLLKISKKCSEVLTYGLTKGDFHAEKIEITQQGTRFDLVSPKGSSPLFSPLIRTVNIYNILAEMDAAFAR